jgi:transcriptional regulator with XRE-family HTH domain
MSRSHLTAAGPLPERIRNRRMALRLSAKQVSTRAGISRAYYYMLEHTSGANPSAAILERLARVLAASSTYLLGQTDLVARGLPLGAFLRHLQTPPPDYS